MKVSDIITPKSVNPRKKLRDELIEHYAEIFDLLPPVVVQKGTGVLIDGFHRIEAVKYLKREVIDVVEMDIPDNELFVEALRRNLAHGLPLTSDERNEAILRLYREGWKQEALANMWGIDQGQISRIVGAYERTQRICTVHKTNQKLTSKHEEIIRRADEHFQDKVAEVVLTRKPKRLTVAQTNTLVTEINDKPEQALAILDTLLNNPQETRIIGTDDYGNIEEESVKQIIEHAKAEPGLLANWASLLVEISEFKVKYPSSNVAEELVGTKHGVFEVKSTIDYFDDLLVKMSAQSSRETGEVIQCRPK